MSFSISKVCKIEGGTFCKCKCDVAGVISVAGTDYLPLSYTNRLVVPLFLKNGYQPHGKAVGWPRTVVQGLKRARNKFVDDHIATYMDPMAEVQAQVDQMNERVRILKYHEAQVPQSAVLAMPSFTTDSGEHVDSYNVKVLTCQSKTRKLYIELSESNMKLLSCVCQRIPADKVDDEMDSDDETQKIESVRAHLPEKIYLGVNKKSKRSWFLRTYVGRRVRMVTINYGAQDSDDEIKVLLDKALRGLQNKVDHDSAASSDKP